MPAATLFRSEARVTSQSFWIAGQLPGLNEIIAASKKHFAVMGKLKRTTEEMIGWHIRSARIQQIDPTLRVRLEFHWHILNRKRDLGNVRAGEKFISDALVACRILRDDSPKYVAGFTDEFTHVGNKHEVGVMVTIREIGI